MFWWFVVRLTTLLPKMNHLMKNHCGDVYQIYIRYTKQKQKTLLFYLNYEMDWMLRVQGLGRVQYRYTYTENSYIWKSYFLIILHHWEILNELRWCLWSFFPLVKRRSVLKCFSVLLQSWDINFLHFVNVHGVFVLEFENHCSWVRC